MAEFMAATMQPLALKAAMHDANGRFSSYASEAYDTAVADCTKSAACFPARIDSPLENQQEVMRRILNAEEYGGKVRDLIRKNTINFCPVLLGSLNPTGDRSAKLSSTFSFESTVAVPPEQQKRTVDSDCPGSVVYKEKLSI